MTNKLCFNCISRYFSPGWYAAVMGTGGFANVLYLLSGGLPFLKSLAVGLFFLNIFIFLVFLTPWVARWLFHFDMLKEDLKNPILSNFFVTMPVGGLILGTNFFIIGKEYFSMNFIVILGTILWIFSVLLALFFGVFVIYKIMMSESIRPEQINYSWFITPVASIAIPLLGNFLVVAYMDKNIEFAKFINIIDIIYYGIGFTLFVILSSIILNRFIIHKMPDSMATPTFWIILGPIGVGTVSLMGIADVSKKLGLIMSVDGLNMLSLFLWGFGLWALIITIVITIKDIRGKGIPFSISWWAFIFPLSAYTLSSINVYEFTKIQAIYWYTVLLTVLLTTLWGITFIKSLIGIINGKLLIPIKRNEN